MNTLSGIVLVVLILIWSVIALAAAKQATSDAAPSWFEHVDLMQAVIAGLFVLVLWFMIRTLRKIDTNQANLFEKYDAHERRLSHLEGAHETRTGMKLSCSVEK